MLGFFKHRAIPDAIDTPAGDRTFAPGTELPYDAGLIANFKADHLMLFKHFDAMVEAANNADLAAVAKRLRQVSATLHDHLLRENVRLYAYLAHCVIDGADKALVAEMRGEMNRIGRAVMHFIRHWSDFPVAATTVASFIHEAADIRAALAARMQREESALYTLYLPPAAY